MKIMNSKIELYRVRSFSDKFDDTFLFLRQNWKPLLRFLLYLALPLSLVEALSLGSMFSQLMGHNYDLSLSSILIAESFYILVAAIVMIVVQALAYSLIKLYESGTDLLSLSMSGLWPTLRHTLWRSVVVVLAVLVITIAIYALVFVPAFISPFLLIVTVFIGLALFFPVLLIAPAYLLDDSCGIVTAVRRAFRYGFKTFWGLVAFTVVFGLLAYMVSGVLQMPLLLLAMLKTTLAVSASPAAWLITLAFYVAGVVSTFASAAVMSILCIGMAFYYGHAAELLDNVSVADDIDRFEQMADNNVDAPQPHDAIDDFDEL